MRTQLQARVTRSELGMVELGEHVLHVEDVPTLQLSTQPPEHAVRGEVSMASN